MSKIAFFCIPAHGHTNPTLEVVKELIHQGHEVRYYSYDIMKEKIASSGAQYISCDQYDHQEHLKPEDGKRLVTDLSFAVEVLATSTLTMDKALLDDMRAWKPDCIVADSMALWGKLIALKLDIPFVSSTTTFAYNHHSSQVMKQTFGELIKVLWQMFKAQKHIKKLQAAGYPIKNALDIIQNDNNTNTIVYTSPEFQPCSETFSDKYSFVGPVIRQPETETPPAKPIERTLHLSCSPDSRHKKTLYISLGTVNNNMLGFYQNCIDAFRNTDIHVIISVGNAIKSDAFENLPKNIEIYNFVDQIAVLKTADAFITHCGMNSVNEALYYQVPLILFPQTKEQEGVAYRVNELGAGIYLEDSSIEKLKTSTTDVLNNPIYLENAKLIAESFYRCGGSKEAVKKILSVAAPVSGLAEGTKT